MQPVAYLRRSTADDDNNRGDTSRDVQEAAIRALAHKYGHNGDVRWYVDWGLSADESKIGKRTEYRAMMRAVEAGEVSVIFAYALDRLHRSVVETGRMMAAIRDHRVKIVTQLEGEISDDEPVKWMLVTQLAAASEFQLRVMKQRAADNIERRRRRGDHFGVAPYGTMIDSGTSGTHRLVPNPDEDVSAVVEAWNRTGSFRAAARLLSSDPDLARRAPPRVQTRELRKNGSDGKPFWADTTVANVLRRNIVIPKTSAGSKARADHLLHRLLICPRCGTPLTGTVAVKRRTNGSKRLTTSYRCNRGGRDPQHGGPWSVSERKVLPWIKAELARFTPPGDRVQMKRDAEGRLDDLKSKRERVIDLFADGIIGKTERDERLSKITEQMSSIELETLVVRVPQSIEWSRPPAKVNALVRALVERIELDDDMQPVRAVWHVPQWRADVSREAA